MALHYPADVTDPHVRVMTLNLNWDAATLGVRAPAAAADIVASDADVVCLQEVAAMPDGTDAAHWLAAECGMRLVAHASHDPHPTGQVHGVAILTRLDSAGDAVTLELPDDGRFVRRAVAVPLRTLSGVRSVPNTEHGNGAASSGRTLWVITTHLAWGGTVEDRRLAEAVELDRWAQELSGPDDVTVLTGDFNTLPTSDTLRFLTGLSCAGGRGAYWVDAWDAVGDGPGYTQTPANSWVADTARSVGITRPELMPSRRIDYVLVRGWAYGRPGSPLAAVVTSTGPAGPHGVLASDHYGLTVDLWDPPTA